MEPELQLSPYAAALEDGIRTRIFDILDSGLINQKEFARILNISPQTITDWKKGKSRSFLRKLPLIAQALGTSLDYLFFGETKKTPTPVSEDRHVNTIAISDRKGNREVKRLSDKELQAVKAFIDLLPGASDDL